MFFLQKSLHKSLILLEACYRHHAGQAKNRSCNRRTHNQTRPRTQNRQRHPQRREETNQIMNLHTNVYRHIYLRFSGTVSVVPDTGSGCNPLRST